MEKIPKRKKSKDNPYTFENREGDTWIIKFKDGNSKKIEIEISDSIHNAMNEFELEDKRQMNKYDRNIEHSLLCEQTLNRRALNSEIGTEEKVIRKIEKEELIQALNKLTLMQKRRIIKYFFYNKTEYEIAKEEGVTQQVIHIGLVRALEKLKKFYK